MWKKLKSTPSISGCSLKSITLPKVVGKRLKNCELVHLSKIKPIAAMLKDMTYIVRVREKSLPRSII